MKYLHPVVLFFCIFLASCSTEDQNLVNNHGAPLTQNAVNPDHMWELIIDVVNNNGVAVSQNFCVYRTQDNTVHGCGTNGSGPWAANVDEIQWPQIPEEIVPNLLYGVEYKIQTSPNDHSDVLIIKYLGAGSTSPDSYFRFNVDTGRMTIVSLGENVEARILAGKR